MYTVKLEEGSSLQDYNSDSIPKIKIESREKLKVQEFLLAVIRDREIILEAHIETSSDVLKPDYLVVKNNLYIGIEHSITIINLESKALKVSEVTTVFFNFLYVAESKTVIAVCEADLIFLSDEGEFLFVHSMSDIITDVKLVNGKIKVTLFEGENIDIVL